MKTVWIPGRLSDYCAGCRFDPDQKTGRDACPFNYLYRDFIGRRAERLAPKPRMRAIAGGWLKRSAGSRALVQEPAQRFLDAEVPE